MPNPPVNLTVYCAAHGTAWVRRAERALASVLAYAPDVVPMLYKYKPNRAGTGRIAGLLDVKTPWVLFLDADVLATGDVRQLVYRIYEAALEPPRLAGMAPLLARKSSLHEQPAWHQDRYVDMLHLEGLPYRTVVWQGVILLSTPLAQDIARAWEYWRAWYDAYRPRIFERKHRKWDQVTMTLCLADAGVLDDNTYWVGGDTFSWHSRPDELGIVHHFNGKMYATLERAGELEAALGERHNAQRARQSTD